MNGYQKGGVGMMTVCYNEVILSSSKMSGIYQDDILNISFSFLTSGPHNGTGQCTLQGYSAVCRGTV